MQIVLLPCFLVGVPGCASLSGRRPRTLADGWLDRSIDRRLEERVAHLDHPLLPPVPIDARDGLSPDEVALLAVANNPDLREARDARGLAHAQVVAAGLLPNPVLALSADLPTGGQTSGAVTGYTATLGWSASDLRRRGPRTRAALRSEESVALDIAWSEWQLALRAQLSAYRLLALRQALAVHRSNVRDLQATRDRVRRSAKLGAVTAAQLVAAQAAYDRARAESAGARREIAIERATLAGLLGSGTAAVRAVGGALPPLPDLRGVSAGWLLKGIEDRRLDLRAMKRAMKAQDAAFDAAVLEAFPDIELGVTAARDTGDLWTIGPSLVIGLPILNHGQAGRAAAEAERTRLTHRFEARLNETRRRLATALATLRGASTRLAIVRQAIVSQARLVDLYRKEFERGLTDALVYYQARSALTDLRLQDIAEQVTAREALVELRAASGYYRLPKGPAEATKNPEKTPPKQTQREKDR